MKTRLLVAALCALTSLGLPATAAAEDPVAATGVYIVQLDAAAQGAVLDVREQAAELAGAYGGRVLHVYRHVLQGFAARLTPEAATALAADPLVASVNPDVLVRASDTQTGATYGLDRSDQRALPLDGSYSYPADAGEGAHVYVIDTGLAADHVEFAGRVGTSRNFVPPLLIGSADPAAWDDCNGHGTHVASTAAGTTWGIAKRATVHAVRVLDCQGSGTGSAILAGMDWVAGTHQSPAVANMSLGTLNGRSSDIEDAARNLVDAGVALAVAAGNDNTDACTTSPAAEPAALTVGSSTATDARSSFSNFGTCVDLFAPGSGITAANSASTTGSTSKSGTSMASPHVAGALALARGADAGLTAVQAQGQVVADATTGVITNAGSGSPNRLLFVPAGDGTPEEPPGEEPPGEEPPDDGDAPCSGCTHYQGTLSSGGQAYHPGTGGFSWSGGTLRGYLRGPAGADFDLHLERRSCVLVCTWGAVASAETTSSDEDVAHNAASGTYRWRVVSYSGSGAYDFWGQPQ